MPETDNRIYIDRHYSEIGGDFWTRCDAVFRQLISEGWTVREMVALGSRLQQANRWNLRLQLPEDKD